MIAQAMELVPRSEVPDMPDRIIAAGAVVHKLPLVSQDSEIGAPAGLQCASPGHLVVREKKRRSRGKTRNAISTPIQLTL